MPTSLVTHYFHSEDLCVDICTGWDTKIRNLLFGLFWLEQVPEICSNVQYAVNKYAEIGQSKHTKQKVPDFGIPPSVCEFNPIKMFPNQNWGEEIQEKLRKRYTVLTAVVGCCTEGNFQKLSSYLIIKSQVESQIKLKRHR